MVALLAAGVLSYAGKMDLTASIVIASVSNFLGDMLLFYMGRNYKTYLLPYLRRHRRKLALSHLMMKRRGSWIILMQKFLYGVKTLVPVAIGLTRYDIRRFGLYNLLSSAFWGVAVGGIGYGAGEFVIRVFGEEGGYSFLLPLFGLAVVAAILWYLSRIAAKR